MIALRGLTKRYGGKTVVDHLSFEIAPGGATGFPGPNGAGGTVFASDRRMSEMRLTADRLVIIGQGRLLADVPVDEVATGSSRHTVKARVPAAESIVVQRVDAHAPTSREPWANGAGSPSMRRARSHEPGPQQTSLEQAYMELTGASVAYPADGTVPLS